MLREAVETGAEAAGYIMSAVRKQGDRERWTLNFFSISLHLL